MKPSENHKLCELFNKKNDIAKKSKQFAFLEKKGKFVSFANPK